MSRALPPAVEAALETVALARCRGEVYVRSSTSELLRRDGGGRWEVRTSREQGVACRVAGGGRVAFAAASGGGARAGRDAADGALAALVPGADPLPPSAALGEAATPPHARASTPADRQAFANALEQALATLGRGVRAIEIRVLDGRFDAVLATTDAFVASASGGGSGVELLLAPDEGPWRLVTAAARSLADLDPRAVADRAASAVLLAPTGRRPRRRLADVVLAPAVAAPLIEALARALAAADPPAWVAAARPAAAWRLVDQRAGPDGLLPLPFDGEGLPGRSRLLIAGGSVCERLTTWRDDPNSAGGAVRRSYREPPVAGPANLVAAAAPVLRGPALLDALGAGFYLGTPAGAPTVDPVTGRFLLLADAVAIRSGRAVARHPLVELRGSLARLLAGLAAGGDDLAGFWLGCPVTTPSLLVRSLEVA